MKSAVQKIWKIALQPSGHRSKVWPRESPLLFITSIFAAAMTFLLAGRVQGQDSQFLFDPNGNLLVQAAASTAPPLLLRQPQNQVVAPGDTAFFSVVVADVRDVSYQWQFNGADISGATADTFLLPNAGAANEGPYRIVVTNPSGSISSASALLWLDSDGDGLPDSWELAYFGNLNQTATGDFDGDERSNLQEFLDGTNPDDTNSVLYQLTILSDGGSVVAVPNRFAYTNGETVTLTATAIPPGIFHGWTGDFFTHSNVISVTMTNNKSLFAHFLPIDTVWTNLTDGDWNVAANWTPNLVPGAGDNALITNSVTVSLNGDAECLGLTLGSSFWSPTLAGTGSLTLHGVSLWLSGTMAGPGRTVVDTGASLNLPGMATVGLNGSRTLDNAGTVFWTGTADLGLFNSVITNRPGALFDAEGTGSVYLTFGSPSRFDNAGTFRKTNNLAATTVSASISFNNYGAAEVQSGALVLAGGGLNVGSIYVQAGATLNLAGGTFTSTTGSTLTGPGNLTVSGAAATLTGLVNVSGVNTFNNGTANLTGNYICTNNTLIIAGGTTTVANFDGTGIVAPAILNLSAGTLGGANTVTVGNVMYWSGAAMSGTGVTRIPPGVTLFITNSTVTLTGNRTLDNAGTVLWTGSASIGVFSSIITNRPGALFDADGSGSMYLTLGTPSRFDNAGIFQNTSGLATTTVSAGINFNNYGTVDIQTGALLLAGGGLNAGAINVGAGTTLNLAGGTFASTTGSTLTGPGNLTVSSATATLAGLINVSGTNTFSNGTANLTGNYICTNNALIISGGVGGAANFDGTGTVAPILVNLSGGSLGGANAVTVGNLMYWSGAGMTGTGVTRIPPGVTLFITNSSVTLSGGRTLDNAGTVLWTGSASIGVLGAVITNRAGALFDARSTGSLYLTIGGASRFDNVGTFRKSATAATMTITTGITFNNYGILEIPRGILSATGGFTCTSNAFLKCSLAGTNAGTDYGQLQASGTVTLQGALSVDLANGFLPATNASFTVLTAGSRNGAFANFFYPSNLVTMQLSNTVNSVLVRVNGINVPILLQPLIAGSNILLSWTAVSNTAYRIEFKPGPGVTNWNVLPGDVTASNSTASKLDPVTPSNRFYRVRVLP
jgi:hypothetical protein